MIGTAFERRAFVLLMIFILTHADSFTETTDVREITGRYSDLRMFEHRIRFTLGDARIWITDARTDCAPVDEEGVHGVTMFGIAGPGFLCAPVARAGLYKALFTPGAGEQTVSPGAGRIFVPYYGWGGIANPYAFGFSVLADRIGFYAVCPRYLVSIVGEEAWENQFEFPLVSIIAEIKTSDGRDAPVRFRCLFSVSDVHPSTSVRDYSNMPFYLKEPLFHGGIMYSAGLEAIFLLSFSASADEKKPKRSNSVTVLSKLRAGFSQAAGLEPGCFISAFSRGSYGSVIALSADACAVSDAYRAPDGAVPEAILKAGAALKLEPFRWIRIDNAVKYTVHRALPVPSPYLPTDIGLKGSLFGTLSGVSFGTGFSYETAWDAEGKGSVSYSIIPVLRYECKPRKVSATLKYSETDGNNAVWKLSLGGIERFSFNDKGAAFRFMYGLKAGLSAAPDLEAFFRLDIDNGISAGFVRIGTRKPIKILSADDQDKPFDVLSHASFSIGYRFSISMKAGWVGETDIGFPEDFLPEELPAEPD